MTTESFPERPLCAMQYAFSQQNLRREIMFHRKRKWGSGGVSNFFQAPQAGRSNDKMWTCCFVPLNHRSLPAALSQPSRGLGAFIGLLCLCSLLPPPSLPDDGLPVAAERRCLSIPLPWDAWSEQTLNSFEPANSLAPESTAGTLANFCKMLARKENKDGEEVSPYYLVQSGQSSVNLGLGWGGRRISLRAPSR